MRECDLNTKRASCSSKIRFITIIEYKSTLNGIACISDNTEDIKTREDRLSKIDIIWEGDRWIVATADRIWGGYDGASSLK